ncbi:hypothetical protein OKW28_008595 [Paraburkholderia sp. 40]
MSHGITRGLAMAIATAPFLIACGGGKADNPNPVTPAQCSGASCGTQGAPMPRASTATLCPDTAALVKSTYLGGAGSGEIVQLNIDATAMTYTLKWLESPIPLTSASVSVTRRGTQITGAVIHPPTGMLPTAEQTRCAFILGAGTGTASDGTTYTTPDFVDNPNPPMILIGKGVAGGGIPGATIQYAGTRCCPAFPPSARSTSGTSTSIRSSASRARLPTSRSFPAPTTRCCTTCRRPRTTKQSPRTPSKPSTRAATARHRARPGV